MYVSAFKVLRNKNKKERKDFMFRLIGGQPRTSGEWFSKEDKMYSAV